MNKIILSGRLTKEPELRYTPGNGAAICTLNIAVNKYNTKTGENEADFFNIEVWNKQAESCANCLQKGSMVVIDGIINNNNYEDKNGNKVYSNKITANRIEFCGSKPNNNLEGTPFDDGVTQW